MSSIDTSEGCAVIRELENDVVLPPGSLSGISVFIEDCQDRNVYIFDCMDEVRIENCVNCCILLGPASSTVNVIGCTGCVLVVTCKSLRVEYSEDCVIHVSSEAGSEVHSSRGLRFCPIRWPLYQSYPAQLVLSNLTLDDENVWEKVHCTGDGCEYKLRPEAVLDLNIPYKSSLPYGELLGVSCLEELAEKFAFSVPPSVSDEELIDIGFFNSEYRGIVRRMLKTILRPADTSSDKLHALVHAAFDGHMTDALWILEKIKQVPGIIQVWVNTENVLDRLSRGELSVASLEGFAISGHSVLPFVLISIFRENCALVDECASTWFAATQAVISAGADEFSQNEILDSFLDVHLPRSILEADIERGGQLLAFPSRLARLIYVWSGGNLDLSLHAATVLRNEDFFGILEAAVQIDGISDKPAFEFVGVNQLSRRILEREEERKYIGFENFLRVLSIGVENISERISGEIVPSVVMINLEDHEFGDAVMAHSFCPEFRHALVSSQDEDPMVNTRAKNISIKKIRLSVSPPRWRAVAKHALVGHPALVTVSSDPNGNELWSIDSFTCGDIVSQRKATTTGYIFEIPCPVPEGAQDQVKLIFHLNESVPVTVTWGKGLGITTTVPVLRAHAPMRSVLSPTSNGNIFYCGWAPDELPPGSTNSHRTCVSEDELEMMTVDEIKKLVRESDCVVVSESVVSSLPFIAGIIVALGKDVFVVGRNELVDALETQGQVTVIHSVID